MTEGVKDAIGNVTVRKRGEGNDNTTEVKEGKRMSEMSGAKQSVGWNESPNKEGGLTEKSSIHRTSRYVPNIAFVLFFNMQYYI